MNKQSKLLLALALIVIMSLINGCATLNALNDGKEIPGNYPQKLRSRKLPSQTSYPNEILAASNFKISSGRWFNLKKAQQNQKEQENRYRNSTAEIRNAFESNEPSQRVRLMSQYEGFAYFNLGFWLNPSAQIHFQSYGGLKITLQGPQGETAQASDQGCILAHRNGGNVSLYDTYREKVILDRGFNDQSDYRKIPDVVYVRLDEKYYGWKVVSLELDYDKVVVQ